MRILKIQSLVPVKEQWIDRDEIMLHACFQLLTDCVEQEGVDTHCDYETHKDFVDEVRALYAWWQKRKTIRTTDDQSLEDDVMLIRLMKIRRILWT